ncbi:MAG: phosphatase PAP2 family protein [Pseudomonadota bacterium]
MDLVNFTQELFGPGVAGFMELVTDLGGPIGWLVLLHLIFIFAGIEKGLQLTIVGALALITNTWLKVLLAQPRPFWIASDIEALRTTGGFGMPSGHAQGAVAFWGYLSHLTYPKAWYVAMGFAVFAVLTGLTRIYLGVHSAAQVLVGLTLGLVCLLAVIKLWPMAVARISSWSLQKQSIVLAGVTGALIVIDQLVIWIHSSFVVDPTWLNNAQATADRLGTGESFKSQEDLSLASGSSSGLVLMITGYLAIGICNQRWTVTLQGWVDRLLSVIVMLLFTALFLWLASSIAEQIDHLAVTGLFALAYPICCVYGAMLTIQKLRN